MINRLLAVGDALDGEYRKAIHLVVVAGMVAERPFQRGFVGGDVSLQHQFGAGRDLQFAAQTLRQFGARPTQQPGKRVFRQGIRHRRHRRQNGRRIGAQRHRDGKWLTGSGLPPVAEIQRSAAMGQPAHDYLIPSDHLLAVNPQILARLVRSPSHHQAPGNQRPGILRPTVLHRQSRQIHVGRFDHSLLTGWPADLLRRHVQHLPEDRQFLPGIAHPLGRVRLLEKSQQFADLAQRFHIVRAHAQRHPSRRAEQIT